MMTIVYIHEYTKNHWINTFDSILETELRVLCMLGRYSTTELHSQPQIKHFLFKWENLLR
jgi:hypothetical protein